MPKGTSAYLLQISEDDRMKENTIFSRIRNSFTPEIIVGFICFIYTPLQYTRKKYDPNCIEI